MAKGLELLDCDVLVIGGGLAGCLAAITAKQRLGDGGRVVIVDKATVGHSGQSAFAAGILTGFDPDQDQMDIWMDEIVNCGEFLNDQAWCKLFFEQGLSIMKQIDSWAAERGLVIFARDHEGKFLRRRARGNFRTSHFILNPLPMMDTLVRKLREHKVVVRGRLMVTDLLMVDGEIKGAVGIDYAESQPCHLRAKAVILAASGCGFRSMFTGHHNLTGDLQAAAFDAGVAFRNMEQWASNVTSREYDVHGVNLYVDIGGRFLNSRGEEFMWDYHPAQGNWAGFQYLALAFCREVREGRGPIYLDLSAVSPADQALCRQILPEEFLIWDRAGIDPFVQPVEWLPAFYGTITSGGGIDINPRCETNIPGLYAAGDITCMPPHGTYAFRGINLGIASTSGLAAGENAAAAAGEIPTTTLATAEVSLARELTRKRLAPLARTEGSHGDDLVAELQGALIPIDVGFFKTAAGLRKSWDTLESISERLSSLKAGSEHELVRTIEVESMVKMARLMVASARVRLESRGWHFREDFPFTDNENWLKWVISSRSGDGVQTETRPVPTPYVQPAEGRSIPPGIKRVAARV